MRYKVQPIYLDIDHPFYRNDVKVLYHIYDNQSEYLSMTSYTSSGYADRIVDDLNSGIGWIT